MPNIFSRPNTTIQTPPSRPTSKRHAAVTPDDMPRGCTARNTTGKKKKRKIVLENNGYYNAIIARIDEIQKIKHTGQNRLATIDHLQNTADGILCKECVTKEIEGERQRCVEIIAKHLDKKQGKQSKEGYISELTSVLKKMEADAPTKSFIVPKSQ